MEGRARNHRSQNMVTALETGLKIYGCSPRQTRFKVKQVVVLSPDHLTPPDSQMAVSKTTEMQLVCYLYVALRPCQAGDGGSILDQRFINNETLMNGYSVINQTIA